MHAPVTTMYVGRHQTIRGKLAAAALVTALLLGGCSQMPGRILAPAPDQTLFLQGLDALPATDSKATDSPAAFSRLAREYPDSPWTARAKSIEKILARLKEQQQEHSQREKKIEECRVERDRLAKDVRSLEEHALRLKSLLGEAGIAEPVPPRQ